MSDEEVIRRRLMIDGDGTGDDRRINNIIKGIIKWSNMSNLSMAENLAQYDRLAQYVAQCAFSARKAQAIKRMSREQLEHYKDMQLAVEAKIVESKNTREKLKGDLREATVSKGNRVQYELLTQSICKEPARSATLRQLEMLRSVISQLEEEMRNVDLAIDKRRKECYVLSTSAYEIRELFEKEDGEEEVVEEEEEESPAANCSLDDIANSPNPELMISE